MKRNTTAPPTVCLSHHNNHDDDDDAKGVFTSKNLPYTPLVQLLLENKKNPDLKYFTPFSKSLISSLFYVREQNVHSSE